MIQSCQSLMSLQEPPDYTWHWPSVLRTRMQGKGCQPLPPSHRFTRYCLTWNVSLYFTNIAWLALHNAVQVWFWTPLGRYTEQQSWLEATMWRHQSLTRSQHSRLLAAPCLALWRTCREEVTNADPQNPVSHRWNRFDWLKRRNHCIRPVMEHLFTLEMTG